MQPHTLAAIFAVPAFAYSGAALKRFGSHSIICFALFTYGIRMLWYSQITQVLMFIPVELLHGITYSTHPSQNGRKVKMGVMTT